MRAGKRIGGGRVGRFVRIEDEATLDEPAVATLIAAALRQARVPLDPAQPSRVMIKSIASKRRPRRVPPDPPAKSRQRSRRSQSSENSGRT